MIIVKRKSDEDIARFRKEEKDLLANFKGMSDKELIEAYTIARKKSETQKPEGIFYDRQVLHLDTELQDRGYRQFLI